MTNDFSLSTNTFRHSQFGDDTETSASATYHFDFLSEALKGSTILRIDRISATRFHIALSGGRDLLISDNRIIGPF